VAKKFCFRNEPSHTRTKREVPEKKRGVPFGDGFENGELGRSRRIYMEADAKKWGLRAGGSYFWAPVAEAGEGELPRNNIQNKRFPDLDPEHVLT
jgi:hypothetical protein